MLDCICFLPIFMISGKASMRAMAINNICMINKDKHSDGRRLNVEWTSKGSIVSDR